MTDREPSVPARRASDAERERAAELLRDALASGRISVAELDERTQRVFTATTRTELERVVEDVLVPADDNHPLARGSTALTADRERLPVREGSDGTGRILSIFSGASRKGRWRVAPRCKVVNVFSGVELDLTEAELASEYVELKVVSWFGGAQVTIRLASTSRSPTSRCSAAITSMSARSVRIPAARPCASGWYRSSPGQR